MHVIMNNDKKVCCFPEKTDHEKKKSIAVRIQHKIRSLAIKY